MTMEQYAQKYENDHSSIEEGAQNYENEKPQKHVKKELSENDNSPTDTPPTPNTNGVGEEDTAAADIAVEGMEGEDDDDATDQLLITEVRSLEGVADYAEVADPKDSTIAEEEDRDGDEVRGRESAKTKWYQGCEFLCRTCNERNFEQKHCSDQWGQRMTDKKYTCRECAKSVMHYFTPIQYHLKSCHGMTMEEYGEKHEGQQAAH